MAQPMVTKRKRGMSRLERKTTLVAYTFVAPNFLGFAIFTLIPVICSVLFSFMDWNGGVLTNAKWVGPDNYTTIFKIEKVLEKGMEDGNWLYFFECVDLGISLKNTVFYTFVTVPLTLACSIALAIALNKAVKGAVAFRTIFFPYG